MKILVTGATGFIGTNLCKYLQLNIPNVEFVFITRNKTKASGEYLWSELPKINFDEIFAVIHLAGLAHDTKNTSNDDLYYQVNYELTKSLYDCFLKSKAKKFIYVSSVKAVADIVDGILEEGHQPNPETAYGKSKLMAEKYIQETSLGIQDQSYYILRPCMVHGPGNKGNLNLLYRFVKMGVPYPLGAFDNNRSFLSIENFCFVSKELLEREQASNVFNLADDTPMATSSLFRLIANTVGVKGRVWQIPKSIITMIAKLGDMLKLPVNTNRIEKLTENYIVSNKKIKSALGIDTMPISTEQGLELTISSFNNQEDIG